MKAPDHPVPSGDRTMARSLVKALGLAGNAVEQPSRLRSFLPEPDAARQADRMREAEGEAAAIAARWERDGAPDLWFTYHNHYKAPDLRGPRMSRRFGLPYVIAEASSAPKRAAAWGDWCILADAASAAADLHLCFTGRDRVGIARIAGPHATLADLPPFIDLDGSAPTGHQPHDGAPHLLTVAMMRPGDKLASYRFLAQALALLDMPWSLDVAGDGPARAEVERAFAGVPAGRIRWRGEMDRAGVLRAMLTADLFVWPGFGEAFGLAYLEAQATGLPVVALDTAGVPSVVRHGQTGVLVRDASPAAYADAIRAVLGRPEERAAMRAAGARFVRSERSLASAAGTLARHIGGLVQAGAPVRG